MTAALHRSFAPVVRPDARLLILGSLPGAVSLAQGRYYAHPRNQFWRLAGDLTGQDIAALDYDARLVALLDARIGLWDTVAAATRKGSLDADIRLRSASDLVGLMAELPDLRAIGFNGATSARIGRRQLGERAGIALLDLPSSSPAYTLAFEAKARAWRRLRTFL